MEAAVECPGNRKSLARCRLPAIGWRCERHVDRPRGRPQELRQPRRREGDLPGVPRQLPPDNRDEVRRPGRRPARPALGTAQHAEFARPGPSPGSGGEPLVPAGSAGQDRRTPPLQARGRTGLGLRGRGARPCGGQGRLRHLEGRNRQGPTNGSTPSRRPASAARCRPAVAPSPRATCLST